MPSLARQIDELLDAFARAMVTRLTAEAATDPAHRAHLNARAAHWSTEATTRYRTLHATLNGQTIIATAQRVQHLQDVAGRHSIDLIARDPHGRTIVVRHDPPGAFATASALMVFVVNATDPPRDRRSPPSDGAS